MAVESGLVPAALSGTRDAGGAPDVLRAALAQLAEGVILTDAAGRITFVNDAAARLHGLAQLQVAPDAYAQTYHLYTEDGRPYPSAELPLARAALHGETVVDARWRIRRPDGSEVLAVGSARPVLGPDGVQVGAVITIRDDTARVTATAAVRERDVLAERLRAAFEQSPVSTVVYDARGRPLAANPAFERLWGAGMVDVPPEYSVLADPQLAAAGVLPLIERAFRGEAVTVPAVRYEMADAVGRGWVRWTEAHLYPVRDASGAVEQVVLTHADVTDRRTAEAALTAAALRAERHQALSAALSIASTVDEVAEAVVTHATAVFGAVGTVIARVAPDDQWIEIMRVGALPDDVRGEWRRFARDAPVPLAEVVRTGNPIYLESREAWAARYPDLVSLLYASGQHANAITPLVVDGRVVGVLGAAFDAPRTFDEDERALARAVALQCAQALERARLFEAEHAAHAAAEVARAEAVAANRAKSEFLAVMSHELRTPLNAIGGYASLIEMGIRGPVSPQQREDLARIQASQRHLLGLINEVLNYAKLETGTVHFEVIPVLVCQAVAAAEDLVAPQVRHKGLTLAASECAADVAVRADPEKLRQVLLNLLSNAVKFTDGGGHIDVTAETSRTDSGQEMVQIRVRDTGIGIPADKLDVIFEPFVQVRSDLTRTAEGTGLGLAISRDLARGMGGDLTAESQLGAGSTFTLTLFRA